MRLFSTLGRRLVDLEASQDRPIGIYVCGPTVQTSPHLGHGRAAVVFDVLRRYLEWRGHDVVYVQNVTDVEDKIINAAREEGVSTEEIVARAYREFAAGYEALNVLRPSIEPRATDHIPEMIEIIEQLIARGHAYEADGDVYFAVRSHPGYGKLSGQSVDDLLSGARVEPGEHKRDPLDFALWKAAKPGEPQWDSPWGPGRPGWHIECSAMARKYLGDGFDIHAGGQDLIFPHHENEIAQSEAATGAEFARIWLHNGMLNLGGEKMAKSTGHVVALAEAVERWNPLAVRLFYLRTHYRKPLEFTVEAIADAEASLDRLWAFRRRVGRISAEPDGSVVAAFVAAMEDDLDVAGALGALFEAVREGNRWLDRGEDADGVGAAYDEIMGVLGLLEPEEGIDDLGEDLGRLGERFGTGPSVDALIARRAEARQARDWATADAVRDALAEIGITLEDTPDGVRWHRA